MSVPSNPCDVCHSYTRLFKNGLKLATPPRSGPKAARRRLLCDLSPSQENSPLSAISPSKFTVVRDLRRPRAPLEDHDHNSQNSLNSVDSGCCMNEDSKSSEFRFVPPSGMAPRRISTMDASPRRGLNSPSLMSEASQDEGFLELFQTDRLDEDAQLPSGMGTLLSGRILRQCEGCGSPGSPFGSPRSPLSPCLRQPRSNLRRSLSENSTPIRPVGYRSAKRRLEASQEQTVPDGKRLRPLTDHQSPNTLFRYGFTKSPASERFGSCSSAPNSASKSPPRILLHSLSESETSIKLALQRSTEEELTGDLSRPFALPLTQGKHQDLKIISPETLARLLDGEFHHTVQNYRIVDCRYPYEFEGGHIRGAVNLFTEEQIQQEFLSLGRTPPKQLSDKRDILIFHCEYSLERGPSLSRFLRQEDRRVNAYPSLHYPEIYLLNGGYKAFFHKFSSHCEPQGYKGMDHPDHANELRKFRAKSKSWAGHNPKKRPAIRSLSRLNF